MHDFSYRVKCCVCLVFSEQKEEMKRILHVMLYGDNVPFSFYSLVAKWSKIRNENSQSILNTDSHALQTVGGTINED